MNYYMDMQYILRYIIKVGTSKSSIPKYVQCLLSIYIYHYILYILVILIGCVVATSEYGRVRLRPHRSRDGELGMENQL